MASGFIEITDEKCYAPRWTGFDETVRILLIELKDLPRTEPVRSLTQFLQSRIPPTELPDELEMGWGFVDEEKEDVVSRIIEFKELTDDQIQVFWKAAKTGYEKLLEKGDAYSPLNPDLMKQLIELH